MYTGDFVKMFTQLAHPQVGSKPVKWAHREVVGAANCETTTILVSTRTSVGIATPIVELFPGHTAVHKALPWGVAVMYCNVDMRHRGPADAPELNRLRAFILVLVYSCWGHVVARQTSDSNKSRGHRPEIERVEVCVVGEVKLLGTAVGE